MSALACPYCGEAENLIGHEVRGLYDGVLFWSCGTCLRAWSRDWSGRLRLSDEAAARVQQWNDYAEAAAREATR